MTIEKSSSEVIADMLDVHVLDLLVHIEALLRSTREVQRGILRVRGVPDSLTSAEFARAPDDVRERLDRMRNECDSTRDAVQAARDAARDLRSWRE